jgi:protein-disulfide isomerase
MNRSVVSLLVVTALGCGFAAGFAVAHRPSSNSARDGIGMVGSSLIGRTQLNEQQSRTLYEGELRAWRARDEILAQKYLEQHFGTYGRERGIVDKEEARRDFLDHQVKIEPLQLNAALDRLAENPQLKAMPEAKRREVVGQALRQQASSALLQQLVESARDKGLIVNHMPKPVEPRLHVEEDGNPAMGPRDARVTIVEFADYQCPACARMVPSLLNVMKRFEGKVRWVFRDFPLDFHPEAMPAAIAAKCAGEQGRYFEAHNLLFKNYNRLGEPIYQSLPRELSLDASRFAACRANPGTREQVERNTAAGLKLNLPGTPTYFINGRQFGPQDEESLQRVIEEELSVS